MLLRRHAATDAAIDIASPTPCCVFQQPPLPLMAPLAAALRLFLRHDGLEIRCHAATLSPPMPRRRAILFCCCRLMDAFIAGHDAERFAADASAILRCRHAAMLLPLMLMRQLCHALYLIAFFAMLFAPPFHDDAKMPLFHAAMLTCFACRYARC